MWVPSVLAANLGAVGFPTTWGGGGGSESVCFTKTARVKAALLTEAGENLLLPNKN